MVMIRKVATFSMALNQNSHAFSHASNHKNSYIVWPRQKSQFFLDNHEKDEQSSPFSFQLSGKSHVFFHDFKFSRAIIFFGEQITIELIKEVAPH
jgi:hypothetical protein